ncbi:MAG: ABC transporter ATP-binding protein [Pseudomonadota bacterium]
MSKILEVLDVHSYYGETHILYGVSLALEEGGIVALLGRNGMGKTTLVRSVWGVVTPKKGLVTFKGKQINGLKLYQIAQAGIGVVPQGKHIFPSLSVKENLTMAAKKGKWTLERVYSLFPILSSRSRVKGTLLSGGEQQMLSIARALMTNPEVLLMDEPSEGLAPMVVSHIGGVIGELHQEKLSILLVEQNLAMALRLADYAYILSKGQIVHESTPKDLLANPKVKEKYLAVS